MARLNIDRRLTPCDGTPQNAIGERGYGDESILGENMLRVVGKWRRRLPGNLTPIPDAHGGEAQAH